MKERKPNEKVSILVRRSANFDLRVTAEYHRLEIHPTTLRLLTAGATPAE